MMVLFKNVKPVGSYEVSKTNNGMTNRPIHPQLPGQVSGSRVNWQLLMGGPFLMWISRLLFFKGKTDAVRDVVCQLPPEVGLPPHMGARLKKPAYGMNDAPRRWWNRIDSSLQQYGMIPTRADRCTYVLYANNTTDKQKGEEIHSRESKTQRKPLKRSGERVTDVTVDDNILEYLLDPVTGSPARGRSAIGVVSLHVDDLFMTGTPEFEKLALQKIRKDYQIGSEDKDDIVFTGQRVRWHGTVLTVDQDKAIE